MSKKVLDNNQKKILPLIKQFYQDFYLAGGTAIALQIGHRRSIDFDLFTYKPLNTNTDFHRGLINHNNTLIYPPSKYN